MWSKAILLLALAAAPAGGLQLPPQVLLDQLLLRTERLAQADELDAAVQRMEEASVLAAEHELELPPDFHFLQARTEFAVGLLEAAKESVTEYLTGVGREAESYVEAVALLEDVDRILERRDAPECSTLPEGPACWMELTSHPGCYVWNPAPQATETATWTGECSAGFARGPGTVTWTYRDGEQEEEGNRRYGLPHGEYVVRDSQGWVEEGPQRFGKRHGDWIERTADGAVLEGPYVDGEENGHWVIRDADGDVGEGPYLDGLKNGHWVERFTNGDVREGPYVDGQRNGHWVVRFADARGFQQGPYMEGERHGHWVLRFTDNRGIQEGPYKDGEMHGHWTLRFASGTVEEGPFVDGERQGLWLYRQTDGALGEGPYVNDERNGHWVWRWPDGQVQEGPYVNGEKHGRWRTTFPDGEVAYEEFVRGISRAP